MFRTPKRSKCIVNDESNYATPPSKTKKWIINDSIETSPVVASPSNSINSPSENKRGRPRAEVLNTLILQGSSSPSSIKCTYCNRVFPREKSLQAHLRTHTGIHILICLY